MKIFFFNQPMTWKGKRHSLHTNKTTTTKKDSLAGRHLLPNSTLRRCLTLELVGLVSVCRECAIQKLWFAIYFSVGQHIQLSPQIRPRDTLSWYIDFDFDFDDTRFRSFQSQDHVQVLKTETDWPRWCGDGANQIIILTKTGIGLGGAKQIVNVTI